MVAIVAPATAILLMTLGIPIIRVDGCANNEYIISMQHCTTQARYGYNNAYILSPNSLHRSGSGALTYILGNVYITFLGGNRDQTLVTAQGVCRDFCLEIILLSCNRERNRMIIHPTWLLLVDLLIGASSIGAHAY